MTMQTGSGHHTLGVGGAGACVTSEIWEVGARGRARRVGVRARHVRQREESLLSGR